jgi:hypothetical protein
MFQNVSRINNILTQRKDNDRIIKGNASELKIFFLYKGQTFFVIMG